MADIGEPATSDAGAAPVPPLPASLAAHSRFVKRATCSRCGAPKSLPSSTAYLYCDKCGALVDYDFRVANAGTNAGLTNTVFAQLVAPYQVSIAQAKAAGDQEGYRSIMLWVFQEWIRRCPDAMSPRGRTDAWFRDQMIRYCTESAVYKAFDPVQQQLEAQSDALIARFERVPQPGGAWITWGDDFWRAAELWKQQMDLAYADMKRYGITDLDPDEAPPGVALKMEYSTFCQAWLPHLTPDDGARLLALYGLTDDYVQAPTQALEHHSCGGCGADLPTVAGARVVVCEQCGQRIEVGAGAVPCRQCGAPLDYPVGLDRLTCPYCRSATAKV
jgi:DNA-directed RNA polymerase subunit RPC12/RpoP